VGKGGEKVPAVTDRAIGKAADGELGEDGRGEDDSFCRRRRKNGRGGHEDVRGDSTSREGCAGGAVSCA